MRFVRILGVVAAAAAALTAAVPSAEAAKGNKEHHIRGIVKSVEKDADKDSGTITLTIPEHKNKKTNEVTPASEKTIKVTTATTFVKVVGKKADKKEEPATFKDVHDGEGLSVEVTPGGEAVKVTIGHHHKKKNAA